MSMQVLICPHCGHQLGRVAVNDKVIMSTAHRTCSKCHQPFSWQGDKGKIRTMK